ncbi:MAG: prolipoprotein diacylglyceryl transferase, partial [Candidatus Nealsonbacteria bacterium CG07_land_8_20_14_0_80_40_10]
MIPYKVFDAFKFGPLTLHTWGIFFALGFVAALIYVMSEAIRKKISSDKIFDLSLILLFAGVLGSRLGFVIANYQIYLSHPVEIFKVWDGGLGFISGFLLAILVGWLYIRAQKLDFWKVADIYVPAVALGYFIGRIGCFLTHDHLGKETNFFLGVKMAGKVYHDTSIYTTALALI